MVRSLRAGRLHRSERDGFTTGGADPTTMYVFTTVVLAAATEEPLPIGLTGAVVLIASLLVTAAWLLYLYR